MPFNPKPGTSGTGTNASTWQQFVGASGLNLSSDNPQSQQLQQAYSTLQSQGYTPQQISDTIKIMGMYAPGAGQVNAQIAGEGIPQSILGALNSSNFSSLLNQAKTWETQNAGTNPAERALVNQMATTATQFNADIPQTAYTLTDQFAQNQKTQLNSAIQANTAAANSRGLLYSGMNLAGQEGLQTSAATNTQDFAAETNQNLTQTGEGLTQDATNAALTEAQQNQQYAAGNTNLTANYNAIAEQNSALQAAAAGAIAQGIGGAAGTIGGALTNKSPTNNSLSTTIGSYQVPQYQPQYLNGGAVGGGNNAAASGLGNG